VFPVGGAAGFVETDALAVDGPSLRAALGAADDAAYALQVGTHWHYLALIYSPI
jgi:hypothetical protein